MTDPGSAAHRFALRCVRGTLDRTLVLFLELAAPNKNKYLLGGNMSEIEEPATLAEVVRARAKNRGDAIAFEFEGRQTSFSEFDIQTNRVANALIALGVKPGERIAYLGKNSDIYFQLLLGAIKAKVVMAPVKLAAGRPGDRLHCRGLQGAGAVRRAGIHRSGPQHPGATAERAALHYDRRGDAGLAGFCRLARRAARRRSETRDQPARHRDPALHLRHHRKAEGCDAVARQFSQSGAVRL